MDELLSKIHKKYTALGEDPETYKEGLLHSKPITYWDYIQPDTLLSLQKTRTDFADEKIFIIYHQVTELFLELILHELRQLTGDNEIHNALLSEKLRRINRYTQMLISSFDVMRDGMNYEDYNTFRKSLTPASGFQSVSFRYIELHCTALDRLVHKTAKDKLPDAPDINDYFQNLYWKEAGLDRKTGKMTLTLRLFCEKYEEDLKQFALKIQGKTLEDKIGTLASLNRENKNLLKTFDHLYNIEWPLVHLRTASQYLDKKGENQAATGGSAWKKYLHPSFQQRIFFPDLWSAEEIENWGTIYN